MDGCSVLCSQKLKSVGFPFTNGTCWCYSWNPSCEPSWFWSSITSRFPTTLHHYLLPSKSFPATHSTPCDVLIDNILLNQIHLNTVPMRRWLLVSLPPLIIRHHLLSPAGARSKLTIKKKEKKLIKKKKVKSRAVILRVSTLIYLILWFDRITIQLSLMLSKEPKDNYNVWLLIKFSSDKTDMHPSKGAKQNAVMFTTLPRPTLLKECVEIKSSSLIMKKKIPKWLRFKWLFLCDMR